jgi:hypothetical protein
VTTVMNIRVPQNEGNFSAHSETISFSIRTLFLGVRAFGWLYTKYSLCLIFIDCTLQNYDFPSCLKKNRMVAASSTSSSHPQHEMLIAPSLGKPRPKMGTRNKEPRSRAYATRPRQLTSLAVTVIGIEMACSLHVFVRLVGT